MAGSRQTLCVIHAQSSDRVYHVFPVGTMGFKSPESFMHMVGNHIDTMPTLSTKADIFRLGPASMGMRINMMCVCVRCSFGLLMLLLTVNEDGPKHMK